MGARSGIANWAIPNCKAVFYPEDGHLSIIVDHASEILFCFVS